MLFDERKYVMNKRKVFVILLMVLFCVSVSGCEWDSKTYGIVIETYPDKLTYVARVDTVLDLTGGMIRILNTNREIEKTSIYPMEHYLIDDVCHNIDFNTPGIYKVYVISLPFACSFEVNVVQKPTN